MISLTSPVKTRAHDWPAGAKLAALAAATLTLATQTALPVQAGAALVCLALYALPGRVFCTTGLRRLKPLWPFVALLVIWHLVTGARDTGLAIALRMVTAVGLANLVTMTTRLSDMMAVFRWLLAPLTRFGLNLAAVEIAIGLVIRMVPVLGDKAARLTESWRARSRRRPNWRVVFPLTLLALDDADRVSEALKARGGLTPPRAPVSEE